MQSAIASRLALILPQKRDGIFASPKRGTGSDRKKSEHPPIRRLELRCPQQPRQAVKYRVCQAWFRPCEKSPCNVEVFVDDDFRRGSTSRREFRSTCTKQSAEDRIN